MNQSRLHQQAALPGLSFSQCHSIVLCPNPGLGKEKLKVREPSALGLCIKPLASTSDFRTEF